MQTKGFLITGKVQGVFFRASTKEKARALNLNGWVCNLTNGRQVACVAQGDADALSAFEAWLHKGPKLAVVEAVEVHERLSDTPYSDFDTHQDRDDPFGVGGTQ